ncbi:MAG: ornithine carbamoyltransferase [Pseudomonadota bacterium]|nr:ornithine carbamoyltransferase [Pseudomonadota bacterium]
MQTVFQPLQHASLDPLSMRDSRVLLENARTLQRVAEAGRSQSLLLGKKFGLLCESEQGEEASRFRRAATDLGAHVAHIRPSLSELSATADVQGTARMLGRLYDGIECQGVAPAVVKWLADASGVPVYGGLASTQHPTARLAESIGGAGSAAESRHFMIQSVLLSTIG